jgi:CDP-diacylglycerol--glycerol-3-phosphate 3-phosphatidyltransferase
MKNLITIKPIPNKWKEIYFSILNPLIKILMKLNFNPNTFTTIGILTSCIAAYFALAGLFRYAGILILLAGVFDTIDGQLARASNKVTRFGALFDSTMDRYSEVMYFFGMAFYFIKNGWYLTSVAIAIGLGGSLMVSYVRARAEGLGFECNVGFLQRPERFLLLGIGGIIHKYILVGAIWIIAVMSNVTAIHRIVHVWHQDNKTGNYDYKRTKGE